MPQLRIISTMENIIHARRLNLVMFVWKHYDACALLTIKLIDIVENATL